MPVNEKYKQQNGVISFAQKGNLILMRENLRQRVVCQQKIQIAKTHEIIASDQADNKKNNRKGETP